MAESKTISLEDFRARRAQREKTKPATARSATSSAVRTRKPAAGVDPELSTARSRPSTADRLDRADQIRRQKQAERLKQIEASRTRDAARRAAAEERRKRIDQEEQERKRNLLHRNKERQEAAVNARKASAIPVGKKVGTSPKSSPVTIPKRVPATRPLPPSSSASAIPRRIGSGIPVRKKADGFDLSELLKRSDGNMRSPPPEASVPAPKVTGGDSAPLPALDLDVDLDVAKESVEMESVEREPFKEELAQEASVEAEPVEENAGVAEESAEMNRDEKLDDDQDEISGGEGPPLTKTEAEVFLNEHVEASDASSEHGGVKEDLAPVEDVSPQDGPPVGDFERCEKERLTEELAEKIAQEERERKMQEEVERAERKQRIEAIMNRTRARAAAKKEEKEEEHVDLGETEEEKVSGTLALDKSNSERAEAVPCQVQERESTDVDNVAALPVIEQHDESVLQDKVDEEIPVETNALGSNVGIVDESETGMDEGTVTSLLESDVTNASPHDSHNVSEPFSHLQDDDDDDDDMTTDVTSKNPSESEGQQMPLEEMHEQKNEFIHDEVPQQPHPGTSPISALLSKSRISPKRRSLASLFKTNSKKDEIVPESPPPSPPSPPSSQPPSMSPQSPPPSPPLSQPPPIPVESYPETAATLTELSPEEADENEAVLPSVPLESFPGTLTPETEFPEGNDNDRVDPGVLPISEESVTEAENGSGGDGSTPQSTPLEEMPARNEVVEIDDFNEDEAPPPLPGSPPPLDLDLNDAEKEQESLEYIQPTESSAESFEELEELEGEVKFGAEKLEAEGDKSVESDSAGDNKEEAEGNEKESVSADDVVNFDTETALDSSLDDGNLDGVLEDDNKLILERAVDLLEREDDMRQQRRTKDRVVLIEDETNDGDTYEVDMEEVADVHELKSVVDEKMLPASSILSAWSNLESLLVAMAPGSVDVCGEDEQALWDIIESVESVSENSMSLPLADSSASHWDQFDVDESIVVTEQIV